MQGSLPWVADDAYAETLAFASAHRTLSYAEFDNFTTSGLRLFVIPKDEHFQGLDARLDEIIRALPALKRIFTKPITRLTDVDNILPTEAVRVINNRSMSYASRHSELWGDITEDGLKPRKLLTIDRQENYAIYENVAFSRLISMLLSYVRQNARILKDVLYASRDLQFNLLERTNHIHYFLAIGKLHVGYAKAQESYETLYAQCLEKLTFIEKTLLSKINAPVYKACKKNTAKLSLKKTNVFRLHKDYRQVYVLLKTFLGDREELSDTLPTRDTFQAEYTAFVNALAVFSAGHFNFAFDKRKKLDLIELNASAKFEGWSLRLESIQADNAQGLRFTVKKDASYSICLWTGENADNSQINALKKTFTADEHLWASDGEPQDRHSVRISVYDVDSFRRIQQIILRAMVYADSKRDVCPFCGKPLVSLDNAHVCRVCRTEIRSAVCTETKLPYFATTLSGFKKKSPPTFVSAQDVEGQLHYHNVTPLHPTGKPLCPHCGKLHTK